MNPDLWLMMATSVLGALLLVAILYRRIYRVGDRTAEQVLPFLSPLGAMGVHELFSPVAENHLRSNLSPQLFRCAQRHRVILALEYVRRISNNALVLQQWASHELGRARYLGTPDCSHLSMELVAATVHCRLCSLVMRTRLYCCLLTTTVLPFVTPPDFEALIKVGGMDLLDFYSRMRSATEKLGRYYGEGDETRLAELL